MKCYFFMACLIILFSSCSRSYYLSPFNSLQQSYKAIPLKSDSSRNASYISSVLKTGGANNAWRDGTFAFEAEVHRSHTFGMFNAYYGSMLTLGSYKIKPYDYGYITSIDTAIINRNSGGHFFGGYGFNGGINMVVPFNNGSEWRVIGIEATFTREIGSYLNFRKQLPDAAASIIDRNRTVATIGLTTDIIFKLDHGSLGYKMALGTTAFLNRKNITGNDYIQDFGYGYLSQTLHFTQDRWTGFSQFNLGTQAFNFQFGGSYRLRK